MRPKNLLELQQPEMAFSLSFSVFVYQHEERKSCDIARHIRKALLFSLDKPCLQTSAAFMLLVVAFNVACSSATESFHFLL